MKGVIKVLNSHGHSTVAFDTENGVVEEAQKIIGDAQRTNSALFDGQTKERIALGGITIEPIEQISGPVLSEHEEVLVVPPMAGG